MDSFKRIERIKKLQIYGERKKSATAVWVSGLMKRLSTILLLLAASSLFSQERDISALFSGSYVVYPGSGDGGFFSNYALSFQAGLSIWDTVKIFGEILLPETFEEIKESPVEKLARYSVRLGLWNAAIGYKKHFNAAWADGNVTNIDLHYNITSLTDLKDEDYGGAYLGFIYQNYNNGWLNYDGYGISVYVDTTTNPLLDRKDFSNLYAIPWVKFGFSYTLGPTNPALYEKNNLSYLVSWDIILGFGIVFNTFIPICFNVGYNGAIYASDMFDGAPNNISRNEGIVVNLTLKFQKKNK